MSKYFILPVLVFIISACSGGGDTIRNEDIIITADAVVDTKADGIDDSLQEDAITNDGYGEDILTNDEYVEDISQDTFTDAEMPDVRQRGAILSAGETHTCAVLSDGIIKCWGNNDSGQLGNGTNTDSNVSVVVSGINNAVSVSAGFEHTCAVLSDGSIRCWGSNKWGKLGNGTHNDSNMPVVVNDINNAENVSTGKYHTCAILSDRSIRCWGRNLHGQLGDGTNDTSSVPVSVIDL